MDHFMAASQWTEVLQKGGLDPLDLQAPGIRLYQTGASLPW